MFASNGLMFSYHNIAQDSPQLFEDLSFSQGPNASLAYVVSEYDLGGEGDLFKAPKPIIEEPFVDLDPMASSIPLLSCAEDVMSIEFLKVSEIESSFEKEQLLSDVFYGCSTDLLSKGVEASVSEVVPYPISKNCGEMSGSKASFQKSESFESLCSMEMVHGGAPMGPDFHDFYGMGYSAAAYGIRRSFSEGDIKNLGQGSVSLLNAQHGISEDRKEKLSRYRSKRTKRNFVRKINYACRKTLADNQPRIRGRFAKMELDSSKKLSS
ncbi:hypothetical protein DM860_015357 [Cuscuta australis]|uniref:CCT domain-containing protein n=1 Tax=Cuscuta australis TaxID=267555 RepID=A0A328DL99_9ASTE|nr:hypothetical protein DM860_015357 [Cuscuta australis]